MALKATIFKVDLSIADIDRNYYKRHLLTIARHPSENDVRMMVRPLAFLRYADDSLEFGKGLSTDDEPDLWLKDRAGVIDLWISVGQPDERWLRKASGRAARVVVFSYGGRVAETWWERNRPALESFPTLTVFRLSPQSIQALASLVRRKMTLQCTIQDGELTISELARVVCVAPVVLMDSASP